MKKFLLVFFGFGVVALLALERLGTGSMNPGIHARGPVKDMAASAIPFKGSKPHPLDGKLRIYLSVDDQTHTDIHQTSLAATPTTKMEWIPGATPPSFRVVDSQGTRMVWQVEGGKAVCVQGQEFLAPDPYVENASPHLPGN